MSRRGLAVGLVLVLVVGGVAAFALGVGPAPGGSDTSEDIDDFPTETEESNDGGDGDSETDDGSNEATTPPFTFSIDDIEDCGQTCRDVTVTLFNEQDDTAEDVTVYTRIYAGNSTDESDLVWEGTEEVGAMDANSSVTRTQRVELSYSDGLAIEQNDGWVTIVTTVQSSEETVTFEEERNVM